MPSCLQKSFKRSEIVRSLPNEKISKKRKTQLKNCTFIIKHLAEGILFPLYEYKVKQRNVDSGWTSYTFTLHLKTFTFPVKIQSSVIRMSCKRTFITMTKAWKEKASIVSRSFLIPGFNQQPFLRFFFLTCESCRKLPSKRRTKASLPGLTTRVAFQSPFPGRSYFLVRRWWSCACRHPCDSSWPLKIFDVSCRNPD